MLLDKINKICIFPVYETCMDILKCNPAIIGEDGVYAIDIDGQTKQAFCDMSTDSGGWTVST
jgi:hypothetical protein